MNQLSLSTGSLSHLVGKEYYDFNTIAALMKSIHTRGLIDGFEFQKIAEWDSVGPPRNDYQEGYYTGRRARAWKCSSRHSIQELANTIRDLEIPILSVHANRDVGICLCRENDEDIKRGTDLIDETLLLCNALGSKVAVFHFWDTWTGEIDTESLCDILDDYQSRYPGIRACVENIPTRVEGLTPFELSKLFNSVTLDTRWACMYDELERFRDILPRIANIHLRGELVDSQWVFKSSTWTFDDIVQLIRDRWRYSGLITLEPEGGYRNATLDNLVEAIDHLRRDLRLNSH